MTRGRLAIHAHFYQPARSDPWTGEVPADPTAAPFHDWNDRVDAECYTPNAERGNLGRISWNLGPTLADWLATEDPGTYRRFVAAGGNAMAQAFDHAILPLASAADRRTEIRWGIRDFELRFGRRPRGLWLPETAVDLATLRALADEGVAFTILAPWQAADPALDPHRPYTVALGGDRSIVVMFYDPVLSSAVSFEPEATEDAERFACQSVLPRLTEAGAAIEGSPLALIASDGELYGHHQRFRDLFLQRLVAPPADEPDRGFDVVALADALAAPPDRPHPPMAIVERTSWSCHHGIARWSAECPDAADGRWKGPLRAAFERLAGGVDVATEGLFAGLPGGDDPWAARDAYVDVVVRSVPAADWASGRWPSLDDAGRARALAALEAQRWRLAMFASDAWYWEDPIRPETRQVLRAATRAARIVDELAGTRLEARLAADLATVTSPSTGLDGEAVRARALVEVGRADSPAPETASARGLRATG